MTPLERAARAYHDSTRQFRYVRDCLKPSAPPIARPVPFVEWDDLDDETRSERKKQVRAVLKAIRDPSEGMEDAGLSKARECTDDFTARAACAPGHVYKAMIDAALGDG